MDNRTPVPAWLEAALGRGARVLAALQFAAPLLTRLLVGITFFYTGQGKLHNLDRTTAFFAGLGIPFPAANAHFIGALEFFGGACLVLGLGTRLFSGLLTCSMVVALLTADRETLVAKLPADVTDVSSAVLLLFLIWLVLYGPGVLSADYLIGRALSRKEEKPSEA